MINAEAIEGMRRSGMTWQQVGAQYGLSADAIRSRYRRIKKHTSKDDPIVSGITASTTSIDVAELWKQVISRQSQIERLEAMAVAQYISIPVPSAIVMLSDLHIGSQGTDYRAIKSDAETIMNTKRMYAAFNGDGVDNWIVGRLNALQRGQITSFDNEWALFLDWLHMLKEKFLFVVSGNHDNWTHKLAGVDRVAEAIKGANVLYGQDEVVFSLFAGEKEYIVKSRHKWKGSSVFNPTHGIEVGWERGGHDFDIGIGSHTHIGTMYRQSTKHGKILHAILTGTYKIRDVFGKQIGFASPVGRGSGVLVFDQNGDIQFFSSVPAGAKYLDYLVNSG